MEQITSTLLSTAITVLCAVITTLGALAIVYLNKLSKKAQVEIEKIGNESTQNYLNNVLNVVQSNLATAIDKIEVTLVKQLKEISEDGKLTKEDQEVAAQAAMDLCKQITGEDMINALSDIVGDTETYLLTMIDSIVLKKKLNGESLEATKLLNS